MPKILLSVLSILAFLPLRGNHPAAKDGKAQMVIVCKKCENPKSQRWDHVFERRNTPDFAAKELAEHLQKITGAVFKITEESLWDKKTPAFFVGDTAFARKNGIDPSKLDREEWLYKSIGKNIVIAGGFNWGNDIAVYKFLENELGCLWLSYENTIVPENRNLTIPVLDKRGKPSFTTRVLYIPPTGQKSEKIEKAMYLFLRRNRSNFQREPMIKSYQYMAVHSFYAFVNPDIYFKSHPEYFSMDPHGRRICGTFKSRSGGQLCLSNPEVRNITEKQLRKFIARDRKNTPRHLWPQVYSITQCDATKFICCCPECKKITAREGEESGLLIDFLNDISRRIAKDYPEIIISTSIYVTTEKVPRHIKPEKNISLQWCDLYFNSDCFRPLEHPINAGQKKILEDWHKRGIVVDSIWDYWNMGGHWINPPRIETMVDAIAPDLRYLHRNGVKNFLTETEHAYFNVDTNFIELQHWLGQQLLDDISKDEKKLIALFMKHHYGPAEKPMTEALNIIRKAIANEKRNMFYTGNVNQPFLTQSFFKAVKEKFDKAVAVTYPGTAYRMRVEKEYLPVLRAQIFFDNLRLGKSKKELVKVYRNMRTRQLKARYGKKDLKNVLAVMEKELEKMEFDFPTPEKFKHLPADSIRKFSALDFKGRKTQDAESALKTVVLVASRDKKKDALRHANPKDAAKYIVGVHNANNRQEKLLDLKLHLKKDGKYHWYCIRNFRFGTKTQFFAWDWWAFCDISSVYADGSDNLWDVWFSLKAEGPAYVPNSKKENNFFIESIILTKPNAVK